MAGHDNEFKGDSNYLASREGYPTEPGWRRVIVSRETKAVRAGHGST